MKTGKKNFIQRFGIVSKRGRVSRWRRHFSSDHLEEMFPKPLAGLAKFSEDQSFRVLDVPLLAALAGMFVDKVKADIRNKKMPYGISDLTEMPFWPDGRGFLYAVFVIDGKIVVIRADLIDVNMFDINNDIVVGLTKLVVFWGPREQADKIFDALAQFAREVGFDRIKEEATRMLSKSKQVVKHLPLVIKKYYGLPV